jgi:hypothetical protein
VRLQLPLSSLTSYYLCFCSTYPREAATVAMAGHAVVVHAAETSVQEAAMTQASTMAWVKDEENRATLAEREAREMVSRVEVESAMALNSAREETDSLVRKITLLKGELVEVHQACEVVEENACGLSDAAVVAERWREEFERGHREQLEELTLLQTQGSELCFAIVGPPQVRNHLSEGMWLAALCHTEMAIELDTLRTVVSSTVVLALGCSPDETFWVEVVDKLVAEFWNLEERHS